MSLGDMEIAIGPGQATHKGRATLYPSNLTLNQQIERVSHIFYTPYLYIIIFV